MSLPLGSLPVIDLDGQKFALVGRELKPVDDFTKLTGSVIVISDFNCALQRAETISAEKRFAEAIIEKQLRERGDADGSSKVVIVSANTVAKKTHALYTSIPSDEFSTYWSMTAGHNDHCLLVPMLSVLLRRLRAKKSATAALVFRVGNQLTLLSVKNKQPLHCIQVSSLSDSEADWQRAVSYLNNELREQGGLDDINVEWHSWAPASTLHESDVESPFSLEQLFTERSGLKVETAPSTTLVSAQGEFKTSLPCLLKSVDVVDRVNGFEPLAFFKLEQALPWMAALLFGLSAALYLVSENWQSVEQTNAQVVQQLKGQVDQQRLGEMRAAIQDNSQPIQTLIGEENLRLLSQLSDTVDKPTVPEVIFNIRQSVPDVLNITGIRLDSFQPTLQVTVEGNAGRDLSAANYALQLMIKSLRSKGYQVQDNGMAIKDKDNLFQLVLTLEGSKV